MNKVLCKYDLSGEYGIGTTSKGYTFLFDLEDYDLIKNRNWYVNSRGYIQSSALPQVKMHRLIMGVTDPNMYIDHINHDKTDNRKSNLRIVTNQQNQRNKKPINKSGYAGVSWHKNKKKWMSHITVDKKQIYLGIFDDIDDAIKARQLGEDKYFGEYAYSTSINNIMI